MTPKHEIPEKAIKLNNARKLGLSAFIVYMGLDINGDYLADATDVSGYRVTSNSRTDRIPPYPVSDLTATFSADYDSVTLTWSTPPDYDITNFTLQKTTTRNGVTGPLETVFENLYTNQYFS